MHHAATMHVVQMAGEQGKLDHMREILAAHPHKDARGFEIKRSIVRHAGSAVMLAADERKQILLVRQYRLAVDGNLWELPAGRLDPGENPLQAAKRELVEQFATKLNSDIPGAAFSFTQPIIDNVTEAVTGSAADLRRWCVRVPNVRRPLPARRLCPRSCESSR